ncbi:MAG: signal peptidase I [Patescibacteria group bacterium]|nr:signal peptidase I [Patescibacteria group bacterium]
MDIDNKNENNNKVSFISEVKSFSFETIKIVVISLVVIIGIRAFVMQPFFVSGKSMEPNFFDGDYLIVDEISYRLGEPERGDVIIFHYPYDVREYYIKRVIGLPGEKIKIKDNTIIIYNNENPEGFIIKEGVYLPSDVLTMGDYEKELKNNQYYVLGDNRTASADSRRWGVLEKHYIVGKAWIRAWPVSNFAVFEEINY